ncbi:MAG: DNA translocase FtsK [Bdellovibrionales bacterium]|nr:DNA translocase FtsK [Bdellovibrionales bacterium]
MNQLLRRFRRDITGLVWLSIGIFLGLSLYSYSPNDPSFNSLGTDLKVVNYCGYFGSFLSDLLYQVFGICSWVFVIAAIRLSYYGFIGRELNFKGWRWLWAVLLLITSTSLGSLYFPNESFFANQISVGGSLGVLSSKGLVAVFNFGGVAVILWTMVAVLLVFYTERPLTELFKLPRTAILSTLNWLFGSMKPFVLDRFTNLFSFFVGVFSRIKSPEPAEAMATSLGPNRMFPIESSEEASMASIPSQLQLRLENEEEKEVKKLFSFKKNKTEKPVKRKVVLKAKVQRRIENWELPKLSLLEDPPQSRNKIDEKEIRKKADLLVNKLEQFNVRGKVVGISPGPAVTLFEFKPNVEVKLSNITKLADDLSLALSSESVRIIAPIPGRDVVGIETSNSSRETVYLKDMLAEDEFWDEKIRLPIALGRKADGTPKVVDLRKMPHLLVAGSTGSGKSVFTVSSITSLLCRHSPKTLRLVLVDPKQVDLAAFNELPHLLIPPIREAKKAMGALKWAIKEMEKRYRSMSKFGARGLEEFNEKVLELSKNEIEECELQNEEFLESKNPNTFYFSPQPYIVIIVEEFGDLMAVDKQNVEQSVVRLAQMARACGIHLVLAMQSPRKEVVTGLIKTNIPGRISFKVASKMDSRIILDEGGAERLLTRGDMLFLAPGVAKPERHHGPWVSDDDIGMITQYWRDQAEPEYDPLAMRAIEGSGGGYDFGGEDTVSLPGDEDSDFDERYDEILAEVAKMKEVSASLIQRRFRLGYPRAARLIEIFEEQGVVGPANGSKPRKVLINELK